MDDNVFQELLDHISTPSVPLTEVDRVRFTDAAKALQDARVQAYIEANFGNQVLKLLQAIIPLIAGMI